MFSRHTLGLDLEHLVISTEFREGLGLKDNLWLLAMIHKNYKGLRFVLQAYKLVHTADKIILLHKKAVLASSMHKFCCVSWLQRLCTCASLKHIGEMKTPKRIIFSFANTSQSHFTNQGNYKLLWFWSWQTDTISSPKCLTFHVSK